LIRDIERLQREAEKSVGYQNEQFRLSGDEKTGFLDRIRELEKDLSTTKKNLEGKVEYLTRSNDSLSNQFTEQ
jgi:hypothetical protein